jgi:hypothetical protein
LRAYLKTALAHYLANLHAEESAQKRGGGRAALAFEDVEAVIGAAPDDPTAAFDREWALGLFEGALGELEAELASGARRGPVAVVRQLFRFGEAPPYETLAAEHGHDGAAAEVVRAPRARALFASCCWRASRTPCTHRRRPRPSSAIC